MSQWAEIQHLHVVERLGTRAIAKRLGLNRKTVQRAIGSPTLPAGRVSPPRPSVLDPFVAEIRAWLLKERRLTAKRVGALLREQHPDLVASPRRVREVVRDLRSELFRPEAFIHRTHRPGATLEIDFGFTTVEIAGVLRRGHFLVATLPASNVYFVKVYPFERIECLFDGILAALRYFGGLPERLVLDNTSLAVREVLRGSEREENRAFEAFRGELALHADFCAPRKGWEKGSVEGGVGYARDNCFRPCLVAPSFEAANAKIAAILDADLDHRRLPDGRTAREALVEERTHLRPLPAHLPRACRTLTRQIDKFGHVQHDGSRYDVPIDYAYKPCVLRAFPDHVEIAVGAEVVASHPRATRPGELVLDPRHILSLLAKKPRAAGEASALTSLPPVFEALRLALREQTRRSDKEWIAVLGLLHAHPLEEVAGAVALSIERGSPRLATIKTILRKEERASVPIAPVQIERADVAAVTVEKPDLADYDGLERVAS